MSRRGAESRVAYMQDEDDSGRIVGEKLYAASTVTSSAKEKMNTKKSRRGESPSGGNAHTDSDSTVHPRRDSRMKSSREREKSIPPGKKSVTLATRPAPRHSRQSPVIEPTSHRRRSRDESVYYGLDPTTVTSASSRPRSKTAAPRPASYYGPSRPPVSNARYHHMMYQQPPPQPGLPGGPLGPISFPPPLWQQAPPPAGYPMMPPPLPPASVPPNIIPQEFYAASPPQAPPQKLQQRFNRPKTSIGHRPLPSVDYGHPDDYEPDDRIPDSRRLSMGYKSRFDDDSARGLPLRPSSAFPSSIQDSPFAPPPGPVTLRQPPMYGYGDDQYEDGESAYLEAGPHYDYAPPSHMPRPRRPSVSAPSVYDLRPFATEVAYSTSNRRHSMYGARSVSSGSGFEDKLRQANSYQEEISGGVRLTAEMLREASRTGGPSSRSTRSSGSRDESDWRQSATTRTTRSSNEEDLTIRVKGNALFKYGEAEMKCQDGTEINITSRGPSSSRRVGSSDKSSYADPDDRRGRFDRPEARSRAASQAGPYAPRQTGPYAGYSYGRGCDYAASPFAPPQSNAWL